MGDKKPTLNICVSVWRWILKNTYESTYNMAVHLQKWVLDVLYGLTLHPWEAGRATLAVDDVGF